MTDKKAELPFNLIFAIVAGVVILFLALFFVARYSSIQTFKYDSEMAEKLSILMDPLETGFTSAKATVIELPVDTRLTFSCKYEGIGKEEFSLNTKKPIGSEWQMYGTPQTIYNKYIFSRKNEQGEILYLFSKQFNMPFPVSDLVYLTTGKYCFISPPQGIIDELNDLNASNLQLAYSKKECKKNTTTVCFGNTGCDSNVYGLCYGFGCNDLYEYGFVQKGNAKSYFNGDALLYGAVFSDPELYDCNVKRLLKRTSQLSRLYMEKINLLNSRGCMTGTLSSTLADFNYEVLSRIDSGNVMPISEKAKVVQDENNGLICKVF